VGTLSWEGLALLPNGVLYSTDESRPGGAPGGSVFKFIPTTLWTGGAPITSLDDSPFKAGRTFGLRVGRQSSTTDSGWGNEYGRGWWVEVTGAAPVNLRNAAIALKLTGYYRPEDAEFDAKEFALGNVRFCGTNTGQDVPDTGSNGDNHWGEVYCLRDGTFATAAQTATTSQTVGGVTSQVLTGTVPEYQALVLGNRDFAMMDNIAYSPLRSFWVLNEDGEGPTYTAKRNNDIWACLDDGLDADKLSDACAKLMTLNDLTAESTGGVFDATGTRYFVSIQHNVTGHGIVLEVNGWQ
jgi:secreted PhoX family phosphatase